MVIVGETLTEQPVASPFDTDHSLHCFTSAGLLIGSGTPFVETYTTESSCIAANNTNVWRSDTVLSGNSDVQGILATDGTFVTGQNLSDYCEPAQGDFTIYLNQTDCTAANGTWHSQQTNPLAVLLGDIWIWDAIWGFVNIITAGNLFTLLGSWGFEPVFVQLLQGIMGIYLALTIISIKWQF